MSSRHRAHAEEIDISRACPGCERCLCTVDHDGKRCGKKVTSNFVDLDTDNDNIAEIDPHIRLVIEDGDDLIRESIRLKRKLTLEESTRILTGGART